MKCSKQYFNCIEIMMRYIYHIYYIYVTTYYNFDYNEFYLTESGKFHANLAVTAKVSE